MEQNYFYKYKNKYFLFSDQISKLTCDINSKKIIIFRNQKEANDFQKLRSIGNYTAVLSSNPDALSFWINKKIDFIINPFDFKGKGFDKNTFSILIQNNILPIIILDKIILSDKDLQLQTFKHLFSFNKLCIKYKLPIIILSHDDKASYAFYNILGYNEIQAKQFLEEL